ncbi:MAG TPA: LysM peptidoglycan-binding domain-containing protein [Clostridiales bacterium]|nr:LysM peptidoglycan-binding domain-containing protein [Clostridiales bacterium]
MKGLKGVICLLLSVLLVSSLVSFTTFGQEKSVSYEMYVNNQKVGVVKFAAKGLAYYDTAMQQLSRNYPKDVSIKSDVHFKEVSGVTSYTTEYQVIRAVEKAVEVKTKAYAIVINGEPLCYVKTLQEADRLSEAVKRPYVEEIQSNQDTRLEEAIFSEDLRFEPVTIDYGELTGEQEALDMLQQSTEGVIEHVAREDDTIWDIAIENGMSVDEVISLNPDMDPEKIKPGQTIILSAEKKLLNVVTREIITYEEDIPFETEKKDDNTLLRGQTKILQKGKKGIKEIQARVIRENGIEVSRELVDEKTLKEPVNEIIAVGTKKPPTSSRGSSGSSDSRKPIKDAPAPSNGSVSGNDIVKFALKFEGYPYRRGKEGPNSFDCSGFTYYIYKQFGYRLNRVSRDQALNGVAVSRSNLAPGDLVFFSNRTSGNSIGHVGIYIGNGNMIHASNSREGVKRSSINSDYYRKHWKCARRIIR